MASKKTERIIYWALTTPVALMMLMSAVGYLSASPQMVEGMKHLGYPVYFLKILGTAKLLGTVALLYSRFRIVTEWAYAGFTFTFLGAAFSHFSSGDDIVKIIIPLIVLSFLLGSYRYGKRTLHSTT